MSEDYSYGEIVDLGIEVCVSCGGANINCNYPKINKKLEEHYCFDCECAEGSNTCMPEDKHFYSLAKETLRKIKEEANGKAEMIEDIMTVIKANKDEEYVSAFQLADMIKEIVEKANE